MLKRILKEGQWDSEEAGPVHSKHLVDSRQPGKKRKTPLNLMPRRIAFRPWLRDSHLLAEDSVGDGEMDPKKRLYLILE